MKEFPFTPDEWQRVSEASHAVMNATLADDQVLRESCFTELAAVLDELRTRYGDHPVLGETEADFMDDPRRSREAYYQALRLAGQHQLPTASIRISLAGLMLRAFNDASEARCQLLACEAELASVDDAWTHTEWQELMRQCNGRSATR